MPAPEFHSSWITASGIEGSNGNSTGRFPFWSFTKAVIAVCALKLCEEGVVDLDSRLDGARYTGRPWTDCGYALGLMSGRMGESGRAIGHSGGGPFSVNAIYHFPDRDDPVTVACFTGGKDEGRAEFCAAELAQSVF